MILAMAWRNIWRQPTRTILSMVSMAFTSALLVFMLSFQFGTYDTMKESMLQLTDGFGQLQPKGYNDDPEISMLIQAPDDLAATVRAVGGVTAAAPRATGFALLANGERTFAAAVRGVDPVNEPQVTTLSSRVTQGRALSPGDAQAIVLGDSLVRNLRLSLGDGVTMLGSGADGSVAADVLTLVGIFDTGVPEIDRAIALMPLKRFQESYFLGGAANIVAVSGDSVLAIENAEPRLRQIARDNGLVYLNWAELRPEVRDSIRLDISTAMLMYVTLVVVVVFIVLNTLYMSVLERTREFGVLLAIGMKKAQVGKMVWAEMIFLALLGNFVGLMIGVAITAHFQSSGIRIEGMDAVYEQFGLPARIYPGMTPFRVLAAPVVLVFSITLMGIVPYRRLQGLRPTAAMA